MSRIIDCHCHIYPDAIAERAVAGTSGFYDLPSVYNGKVSQLYELGSKLGVDHYVVFSVAPTRPKVSTSLLQRPWPKAGAP